MCGCLALTALPASVVAGVQDKYFSDQAEVASEDASRAIESQEYGRAEGYLLRELELETKERGKPWSSSYGSLFSIYLAQGRYSEANKMGEVGWKLYNEEEERSRAKYPDLFRFRPRDDRMHYWQTGDFYLEWGKSDLALESLESALKTEYFEKGSKEERDATLAQHYPHLGKYHLQQAEYEKARDYFQQSLDIFLKFHLIREDYSGRSQTLLGLAYFYLNDEVRAEEMLRGSAERTMLARIAEHRGDSREALDLYQSALRAWRENRPEEHRTQQADALNQLGGFYLRHGNLQESSKAYEEAKSLREATTTATHPEYAVTMRGLAAIAVSRNELTSATLLVRKALDVLDASVVPTHARIAPVLVALASIETLNGHPEEAAKINQRLETLLQDRPLAIWKEDFLWTANFYASVLDKAGKTPEAAALRQIHDRQKDRK